MSLDQYTICAAAPMPPVSIESILEATRGLPKVDLSKPISVTPEVFEELKRRCGVTRRPSNVPDFINGVPIVVETPEQFGARMIREESDRLAIKPLSMYDASPE